jgi:hypothetical protein
MSENSDTALPEAFDPETEEGTHFDLMPIGTYVAQITDASVCQPRTNDGCYVALRWQITEGDYENRYVFQNITFMNSSTQATQIGRRQFKDLCVATGISEQVTDVEVLKFIPCRIKVGIEKDKQGVYPDKNRVSRILPLEDPKAGPKAEAGAAAPKTSPDKPAAAAARPTTDTDAAPWRQTAKPSTGEVINDEVPF